MKKIMLTIGAATLALAGTAYAQERPGADGVITKAEHDAMAMTMWQRLDANNDGVLDQADRQARQAERFAKMDANNDGEVTQAEMQVARTARRAQRMERRENRREQRFARLDTDNSGGVSQAEMATAREKLGADAGERQGMRGGKMRRGGRGGMGGHARMMLRQADANGDKRITRAEFQAAHAKRFAMLDADNNGQVTAEERKTARQKMRAEHMKRGGERRPRR